MLPTVRSSYAASPEQIFDEDLTAIFEASPEGRVRLCNPAFARLFGFDKPVDAYGADLRRLDHEGALVAHIAAILNAHASGTAELEMRRVDGGIVHVIAKIICRADAHGHVTGITGYLLDDTPRKALQVQVRHAMKLESVGRLAGGIAHDFNNLLMIIIGLSEGLVELMPPDDPLRADAVQILEAGRRGSSLASQVLAFSRKPHARASRFDADEAIAATTPLIARLLGSRITLEVSCAPGPKWISADRTQLEQVLLNLATNAHDAMPEGGRLTLDTMISIQGTMQGPGARYGNGSLARGAASANDVSNGHSSPRVLIRMSDTGHGMSPETQARIFEPFYTTKVRGKGTGLGLAQVHSIVTEHGGIIEVESADGEGTTFTISLPLASPPDSDSV